MSIKPRVVKQIIDSTTKEILDVPVQKEEQIISKETSEKVLSMMESVVSEGTGKNAKVAGYRIGGKTGTSEDGVNTNKYVTSFCGVAPIDNPQVVLLVTLYNPTGEGGHHLGVCLWKLIKNEVYIFDEIQLYHRLYGIEYSEKVLKEITMKCLLIAVLCTINNQKWINILKVSCIRQFTFFMEKLRRNENGKRRCN